MTLTVRAVQGYALGRPSSGATVRSITAYALVNPAPLVPAPPVPTDYRKPQSEMIYDLIEKSNPGFKDIYPLGSVTFGPPAVITVDPADPYKNDTSILVSPTSASGGLGKVTVKYRRVDLTKLLTGISLKLDNWHTATTAPVAVWTPWFAAKFGISLVAADLTSSPSIVSGNSASPTIVAGCLCYKGAITVAWTRPAQPLNTLITDANRALVGRLYPGGNDFTTPGRKPQGELQLYAQDGSPISATIEALAATTAVAANSTVPGILAIIDWLNGNTGLSNWSTAASTVSGGVGGLTWFKYTIPNAAIPEANSAKYNRCLVIQGIAGSWFAGKLILHYKV